MPGVWAELINDAEIASALPALARHRHSLALALPVERIGDTRFAELTRRAEASGVKVRAWPLLSREHGYWINDLNVTELARAIDSLLAWRASRGGPTLDSIAFDLEPAYDYAEILRKTGQERPLRLARLLLEHIDRTRSLAARETLSRIVERVKRAGLVAHAVAIPMLLDQPESESVLEHALGTPLSCIEWDEVSFMVYQTPFAELVGSWLGPALVHSYAASAVARYGDRAGIDVGIVGNAGVGVGPGNRYAEPGLLHADLEAALSAGIAPERARIYGLKGVLDSGGIEHWLELSKLEARPPRPSRAVAGLRNAVRGLVTGLRVATPGAASAR